MTVMFVTRCSYERSDSVSRTTWFTSTMVRVVWRLRAKVSRLRTMRAARSASWRIVSRPRRDCGSRSRSASRSAHVRIVASGIVQLVRDAGDGGAERRHLLGLQQLAVEVAGLVLEPLAVADVAHEGVEPQQPLAGGLGVGRHLHPDGGAVGAPQPEQIVRDNAFTRQAIDQHLARALVGEAIGAERAQGRVGRFSGIAEDEAQIRVGGQRLGSRAGRRGRCRRLRAPPRTGAQRRRRA